MADEKIAWKAYGNMEEESKKAFAAKIGDNTATSSASSAFDTREFLRSLPGCVVDELAAALVKLQATWGLASVVNIPESTVVDFEAVDVHPRDRFHPGLKYFEGALKN